jgi:hypothetical protein
MDATVENHFYTYAYLREDNTPYYIGKGRGGRAYRKMSRERVRVPKDRSRILILKKNLTEEEAFRHEKYMISVFGRKDLGTGMLINMTEGGQGPSGHTRIESLETRQRKSLAQRGNQNRKGIPHTAEVRRKMSESHLSRGTRPPTPRGKRWYVNTKTGKTTYSITSPGEDWTLGRKIKSTTP